MVPEVDEAWLAAVVGQVPCRRTHASVTAGPVTVLRTSAALAAGNLQLPLWPPGASPLPLPLRLESQRAQRALANTAWPARRAPGLRACALPACVLWPVCFPSVSCGRRAPHAPRSPPQFALARPRRAALAWAERLAERLLRLGAAVVAAATGGLGGARRPGGGAAARPSASQRGAPWRGAVGIGARGQQRPHIGGASRAPSQLPAAAVPERPPGPAGRPRPHAAGGCVQACHLGLESWSKCTFACSAHECFPSFSGTKHHPTSA